MTISRSKAAAFTPTLCALGLIAGMTTLPANAQHSFQKTGARGGDGKRFERSIRQQSVGLCNRDQRGRQDRNGERDRIVKPDSITAQGNASGPNGGSATGTATVSSGSVNAAGTATGKNGQSAGGSVTAVPGSATVTTTGGNTRTFSNSGRSTAR